MVRCIAQVVVWIPESCLVLPKKSDFGRFKSGYFSSLNIYVPFNLFPIATKCPDDLRYLALLNTFATFVETFQLADEAKSPILTFKTFAVVMWNVALHQVTISHLLIVVLPKLTHIAILG